MDPAPDRRAQLSAILNGIPGVTKAYFQAPGKEKMVYPCILYNIDDAKTEFADDRPYRITKKWTVTVIDENPDSPIPGYVEQLPTCTWQRTYPADGLNHTVFQLYF